MIRSIIPTILYPLHYNWRYWVHGDQRFDARWGMSLWNYGRYVPWTFRKEDDSYPVDDSYPTVWTFRTQSLDDSHTRYRCSVPKGWTVRTPNAFFLIFCIWFGIFAPKIVRFILPVECWSISSIICLFISHTWFSPFLHVLFHQRISWVNIKILYTKRSSQVIS